MMALCRARHETINRRWKEWKILGTKYRHSIDDHHIYFHDIAVNIQMDIEECDVVRDVPYFGEDPAPGFFSWGVGLFA